MRRKSRNSRGVFSVRLDLRQQSLDRGGRPVVVERAVHKPHQEADQVYKLGAMRVRVIDRHCAVFIARLGLGFSPPNLPHGTPHAARLSPALASSSRPQLVST